MALQTVLPDVAAATGLRCSGRLRGVRLLHTHLLVREDAQILYGFATDEERVLFRTLLKVNRVGAKMALAGRAVLAPTLSYLFPWLQPEPQPSSRV